MNLMIKTLSAGDLGPLRDVLTRIGLFHPEMLDEMAAPFLNGGSDLWLLAWQDAQILGICYLQPEEMADRVWNMRALGVDPAWHRKGVGAQLVTAAEQHLAQAGARLMVVDTSGTADFEAARAFYVSAGYAGPAIVPDFWEDGDDRLTFSKHL